MVKKPSLDDDYEQEIQRAASGQPSAPKGPSEPVGKVIFNILCFVYSGLGLLIIVSGFYYSQSVNVEDMVGKAKYTHLIIFGFSLILLPFVLWAHFKVIRWLLGIDEVIAELAKLRSKKEG